jgi:Flp pilus assembly secretin CpaC
MLPDFRIRHVVSTLNLRDGQTAIIGGLPEKDYVNGKEVFDKSKSSDKELLVFITVTLVDPAGNRLHSDGDMPFAKNGIPAQPKH